MRRVILPSVEDSTNILYLGVGHAKSELRASKLIYLKKSNTT